MTNNKGTPLKRHAALQPLSREHHDGLLFCWKVRKGLQTGISVERIADYAGSFFRSHLQPHFEAEEKFIFPLLGTANTLVQQALAEHAELKENFTEKSHDRKSLDSLQQKLNAHIRFEERDLFRTIQEQASEDQIGQIEHIHAVEPGAEDWHDQFWV